MTAKECIFKPILDLLNNDITTVKTMVDPRYFKAIIAAPLVTCDPTDQKQYETLLAIKEVVLKNYTVDDLALAYLREFGDGGDTFEEIVKAIKSL